jgi:hypothetical protein
LEDDAPHAQQIEASTTTLPRETSNNFITETLFESALSSTLVQTDPSRHSGSNSLRPDHPHI